MNLIQTAIQKVLGQGKSLSARARRIVQERMFPEGTRFHGESTSRQFQRAKLRDSFYRDAVVNGSAHRTSRYQPDTRKSRRSLARALASAAWKVRT